MINNSSTRLYFTQYYTKIQEKKFWNANVIIAQTKTQLQNKEEKTIVGNIVYLNKPKKTFIKKEEKTARMCIHPFCSVWHVIFFFIHFLCSLLCKNTCLYRVLWLMTSYVFVHSLEKRFLLCAFVWLCSCGCLVAGLCIYTRKFVSAFEIILLDSSSCILTYSIAACYYYFYFVNRRRRSYLLCSLFIASRRWLKKSKQCMRWDVMCSWGCETNTRKNTNGDEVERGRKRPIMWNKRKCKKKGNEIIFILHVSTAK